MRGLIQDLRYAVRMMARNPGFTAAAILTLGLGIGANTAVFTVLNGVLLRSLPFPGADRLFLISNAPCDGPFGAMLGLAERDYLEFRKLNYNFQAVAAFNASKVSLTGSGEPVRLQSADVTSNFMTVLGINPTLGRSFTAEEEHAGQSHVVLLGDGLWRSRFHADPNILGKSVRLDGSLRTVIGIMPAGFRFPYEAEVWIPLEVREDPHMSFIRPAVGRLRPDRTRQQAETELSSIAKGLEHEHSERRTFRSQILPLQDLLVGTVRESLLIFAGAVAFVLLIACANVANLSLMRAASRSQEIAVRISMGASHPRLIRQVLTESVLLALGGGGVGIVLALWGVPALLALAPEGKIPRTGDIHIDVTVLAFTLLVSVLTGLAFGAVPAFQITRRPLSQRARPSKGVHARVRIALVVAEIALTLVLLSGAGLMVKTLLRLRAVEPGFRPDNVYTMSIDLPDSIYHEARDIQSVYSRLLASLSSKPGITAAGAVNWLPLGGMLTKGDFQVQDRQLPPHYLADKLVVSPGYFRSMGIRLLSGRDFSDSDQAGAPGVAVISESVARTIWAGEDALGKRISEQDHPQSKDWLTIIGVVADVRQVDLTAKPGHALYFTYQQTSRPAWLSHMTFIARMASSGLQASSAMRAALREIDPDQPVEKIAAMQDLMAMTTAERVFQTRLLTTFSALALVLAVVGMYGVLAYSVATRTHEIGIRMALGAEAGEVLRMVLRRTLLLTGAGLVVGIAGALAATRVLTRLLFQVKPNDAATLLAVAVILGLVSIAAGWIPARRASHVDPLVALRHE